MDRYAETFGRLGAQQAAAFGAFVTLGDPDLETSLAILDALVEGGANLLELGIPFSDPVADGPVIQASARRALAKGITPADCFELVERVRARHPRIPIGILTYANLVVARGRDDFYRRVARAGIDSVLVADVPAIEAMPFVESARANHVHPVLIAAANTPRERLRAIAELGGGYTYCVARRGVTGADDRIRLELGDMLACLRDYGAPSPVVGFGIASPEHVHAARAAGAAGVISGSAIIRLIAENPDDPVPHVSRFVAEMAAASHSLNRVGE